MRRTLSKDWNGIKLSLSLSSSLNGQLQVDCLQSAFSQNPSSSYLIQRDCKPRCYYLGTETYESREGSSDFRLPTSNFQLLTFDFRLPTSDFRLPTFNFWLPTSDIRPSDFRLLTWQSVRTTAFWFLTVQTQCCMVCCRVSSSRRNVLVRFRLMS